MTRPPLDDTRDASSPLEPSAPSAPPVDPVAGTASPDDDDALHAEVVRARGQLEHRYSRIGLDAKHLLMSHRGTILDPSLEHMHEADTLDFQLDTAGGGPARAAAAQGAGDGGGPAQAGAPPRFPPASNPIASAPILPDLALDPGEINLGRVVGTGGMGVVNVAEQSALKREVAVKRVRLERQTPGAINSLLREAWVTGTLEHPNVVPIHLLVNADDGPRVVMKRIEGVTWDTLITNPQLLAEFDGRGEIHSPEDRLLFHLRVLSDVCQAVSFAHSRGVLHLDLKPDNVMVGRFGEVYVVDWGIAASLPDGPAWLPPAAGIKTVRGTPSWMPPELAIADASSIGVRSDVYLLGGLLHAVLTEGVPRHRGGEMIDLLAVAYLSLPFAYGAKVPPELAELANRATARDIEKRPTSADAFRRAIEDYLAHRASTEIEARASARKDALLQFFARNAKGPIETTQAGQNLRRNFLECRFGFRQALEIWPDNQRARGGLQELLRAMTVYALDNEQLERAAESVSELSPREPELESRLKALARELSDRHERLIALERDASIEPFREKRSLLSISVGLMFILWNVTCGHLHRSGTVVFEVGDLLWFNAATFACFIVLAWAVRKQMLSTATNRRLVVLFGTGFIAILSFWFAAYIYNLEHPAAPLSALAVVSLSNWAYPFFVLAVTFTMDIRVVWIIVPVTAIAMFAPLFETYAFEILGLEGFICGAWLAWIWRMPSKETLARRGGTDTRPPSPPTMS